MSKTYSLAIHGGAGTIDKSEMTSEMEQAYRKALHAALEAGNEILKTGGTAMDAVEQAVRSMEDCPLFNAGKGAVYGADGSFEMDASIMDGSNLQAGAVASIKHIANPVSLARKVFEQTQHVMLCGKGALEFADSIGIERQPDSYFHTDFRYQQWQAIKDTDVVALDHGSKKKKSLGTVGAVAMDQHGNLAAATSTGGMTNKRYSRLGDTPVIGSGTYANNKTCAISCTGHGEFFLRAVVAYDVSCMMEYGGKSLDQAAEIVVNQKLKDFGGEGGLIAVDAKGNISLPYNSGGMYRGWVQSDGEIHTAIHED